MKVDSKGKNTYNKNKTVSYGCSASTFNSMIGNFYYFYFYKYSTRRYMFDIDGNETNILANVTRYEYHVSMYLMRPTSYQQ